MNSVVHNSINIRAIANKWMMDNFEHHRKYLQHLQPEYDSADRVWEIQIITKGINGCSMDLGEMSVDRTGNIIKGGKVFEKG